jgi:ribonucleoside-triphosphate reductase
MKDHTERLSNEYGMKIALDQSHAETTGHRFARLDLKYFSPMSGRFVRGDLARGEVYYTNSTQICASAPVSPMMRVLQEGRFHGMIQGGSATHLWLAAQGPSAGDLAAFLKRVFYETENRQIILSPDFTTCQACGLTSRELGDKCPSCGSESVEQISMITQYFSRVSGWNKGKLAELRDRLRMTSL